MVDKNYVRIGKEDLRDCSNKPLKKQDIKNTIDRINAFIEECQLDRVYLHLSGNDFEDITKNMGYYYLCIIDNLNHIKQLLIEKIKKEVIAAELKSLGINENNG